MSVTNNFISNINCLYSANNGRKCNFKYVAMSSRCDSLQGEAFSHLPWCARTLFLQQYYQDTNR